MRTVYGILAASVLVLSPMQLSAARGDQGFTADKKQVFRDYLDQVAVKKDEGIAWVNVTPDDKSQDSIDFYGGDSGTCYSS